jgi:hypothetical protein
MCDDEQVVKYLNPAISNVALELWILCEEYAKREKTPGILGRLINRFRRRAISRAFYLLSFEKMITLCQKRYYMTKITELTLEDSRLQKELARFNFDKKMNEYFELSAKLFRGELAKKYQNTGRCKFEMSDLHMNSEKFIKEYPVILATIYSLSNSLSQRVMYGYVIMYEASQIDLATGALAFFCTKKAVIVGDLKQLSNVVDSNMAQKTDAIFAEFDLPEVYQYKNHSLLSTVLEMFPNAPRTLLREHYRCHPKIIGFFNQKFYDNQLIILTEPKSECQPLIVSQEIMHGNA